MVRNEEIVKQALTFRKRGFTYQEIAKICGVHHATVARWCRGKRFSKQVAIDNAKRSAHDNARRVSLLQKARQAERKRSYQMAKKSAETEFSHHRTDPLFVAGLLLYRATGDRTNPHLIRLTSQDWLVHRTWQQFVGKYLGVSREKTRFYLVLYKNHDQAKVERTWSRQLSFPVERFGKTQILKQQAKRLHNGTGSTIIGSTVLKVKLSRWIELAEKQL
ncbi:MAG TPA: helix-turn-helix domain-containing protein [Candidatus Paceibacterota bacterium]|nr:helix-turn-helix domain-containing protein [Candidatus Paceibacterota bacterium]